MIALALLAFAAATAEPDLFFVGDRVRGVFRMEDTP